MFKEFDKVVVTIDAEVAEDQGEDDGIVEVRFKEFGDWTYTYLVVRADQVVIKPYEFKPGDIVKMTNLSDVDKDKIIVWESGSTMLTTFKYKLICKLENVE